MIKGSRLKKSVPKTVLQKTGIAIKSKDIPAKS